MAWHRTCSSLFGDTRLIRISDFRISRVSPNNEGGAKMKYYKVNHNQRLQNALKYMISNYQEDICLDDIAQRVGITKFSLCRSFRRELKITPIHWLWLYRTYLSAEVIWCFPHYPLSPIMQSCGFKHAAHFSRIFKTTMNMRPSAFKQSVRRTRSVQNLAPRTAQVSISPDIMQKALQKTMNTLITGNYEI